MSELKPCQTADVEDAIGYMKQMRLLCDTDDGFVPQVYDLAIDALRRSQPANEPLTLAQMREMDGAPVWMNQKKQWVFIASTSESPYAQVWYFRKGFMYTVLYHHEKFYRHKPERSEG